MQHRNILVIEDEEEIRDLLLLQIREHGWTAEAVSDGTEGLDSLRKYTIDVVLSDINMPGLNGLAFLNAIRLSGNNVPVVFLTASIDTSHIKEALRLGAFDFFEKPIAPEELVGSLSRAIDLSGHERAARAVASVATAGSNSATGTGAENPNTPDEQAWSSSAILRAKNNLKR